jgi:hypothetical protein
MHRVMIVYVLSSDGMEYERQKERGQTWSCTFFKEETSTAYFNLFSGGIWKDHLT